jgi:hypothetical protein
MVEWSDLDVCYFIVKQAEVLDTDDLVSRAKVRAV